MGEKLQRFKASLSSIHSSSSYWVFPWVNMVVETMKGSSRPLSLIFMFTMSTPKTMVCVTWNQWIFTISEHTYKIFMECSGVTNLLSSENLVYYVRCLLYINVTNSSPWFCWWNNRLFGISGGLFHMALLYYFMSLFLSMWQKFYSVEDTCRIKFWLTVWNLLYLLDFILCFGAVKFLIMGHWPPGRK